MNLSTGIVETVSVNLPKKHQISFMIKFLLAVIILHIAFEIAGSNDHLASESKESDSTTIIVGPAAVKQLNSVIEQPSVIESTDLESSTLKLVKGAIDKSSLRNLAKELFHDSSANELIDIASRLSFFTQSELENKENPKEFLGRLLEVVAFDVNSQSSYSSSEGTQSNEEQSSHYVSPIYFTLQVKKDNSAALPETAFYHDARAVYAVFQLDQTNPDTQVIVRWFDLTRNKVVSFNRLNIDKEKANQFVWFYPNKNWLAGEYRVSVFQNNDQIAPIADGRFYILDR